MTSRPHRRRVPVYLVLHDAILANRAKLARFPEAARRFLPGGEPLPIGATLRQRGGLRAPARSAAQGDVAGADGAPSEGETTHLSVVDADGNAVALSNTLSPFFGVGAWVEGFYLKVHPSPSSSACNRNQVLGVAYPILDHLADDRSRGWQGQSRVNAAHPRQRGFARPRDRARVSAAGPGRGAPAWLDSGETDAGYARLYAIARVGDALGGSRRSPA